jgi:serine/threonine protein kinase
MRKIKMKNPTLSHGRYRIDQCIGHGGMASVFSALDTNLLVHRAIKVLSPESSSRSSQQRRFAAEAKMMAQLQHPNIVTVHDYGSEGTTFFLVMEMMTGGSLQNHLHKHGVLSTHQAIEVTLLISKGLKAAHKIGIIHRDIKPDNVLLTNTGIPKLTDFGIAHFDQEEVQTRTQAIMGTLPYMSPEQRISAKQATAKSDLYSLTASFWQMLTNGDPSSLFEREQQKHLLKDLPIEIKDFIRKGCHRHPQERHATIEEYLDDLHRLHDLNIPVPQGFTPLGSTESLLNSSEEAVSDLWNLWYKSIGASTLDYSNFITENLLDKSTNPDSNETYDHSLKTNCIEQSGNKEIILEFADEEDLPNDGIEIQENSPTKKPLSSQKSQPLKPIEKKELPAVENPLFLVLMQVKEVERLIELTKDKIDSFVITLSIRKIIAEFPIEVTSVPDELKKLIDIALEDHLSALIEILSIERKEISRRIVQQLMAEYLDGQLVTVLKLFPKYEGPVVADLMKVLHTNSSENAQEIVLASAKRTEFCVQNQALDIMKDLASLAPFKEYINFLMHAESKKIRSKTLTLLVDSRDKRFFPMLKEILEKASMPIPEAIALGEAIIHVDPARSQLVLEDWLSSKRWFSLKKTVVRKTQTWAAIAGLSLLPGSSIVKTLNRVKNETDEQLADFCIKMIVRRRQLGIDSQND